MLVNLSGEPIYPPYVIDGFAYPMNIEALWSAEELAAIGLARGVEPAPEPGEVASPVVSRRQFMLALYDAGMLEQCETFALNHAYPPVKISWQNASEFSRYDPLLQAMAIELGKSDLELDNVFSLAATK